MGCVTRGKVVFLWNTTYSPAGLFFSVTVFSAAQSLRMFIELDISYMHGTESRGYIMVLQSHTPHVLVSLTYLL